MSTPFNEYTLYVNPYVFQIYTMTIDYGYHDNIIYPSRYVWTFLTAYKPIIISVKIITVVSDKYIHARSWV